MPTAAPVTRATFPANCAMIHPPGEVFRRMKPMDSLGRRLSLDARRATLCKGAHLLHGGHGGVTREGRQRRAVRPAQLARLFRLLAREEAVEQAGRKAVSAADAIVNVQLARWGNVRLAVNPGHRPPAMRSEEHTSEL